MVAEPYRPARLVRPYTITRGRSGADLPPIELEALVSVTPAGRQLRPKLRWEEARIVEITRQPLALVEVAARLDLPVGVVRVLVSDLQKREAVHVTSTPTMESQNMDTSAYADLLNRVLDGIKSL